MSTMNKKLTNTKGFPLVMMIFAFLFSAAAVMQEFVMTLVYKNAFKGDNKVDYVLLDGKNFFDVYGNAVTAFVLSFLVMLVVIGGVGKRTTGTKEGVLLIISGVATAITPAVKAVEFLMDNGLSGTESDGELFRAVNQLVCYALPAFVSLLVIFAGLGILIKAGASKTTVEVFKNKTFKAVNNSERVEAPVEILNNAVEAVPAAEEAVAAVSPVIEETETTAEETAKEEKTASVTEIICKNCGATLAAGAKFCKNCGEKQ